MADAIFKPASLCRPAGDIFSVNEKGFPDMDSLSGWHTQQLEQGEWSIVCPRTRGFPPLRETI